MTDLPDNTPAHRFTEDQLDTPMDLRQWGLGWLRTAVPTAWGIGLTYLATRVPALRDLLDTPAVYAVVDGAITLAWYAIFRAIEKHLPAWLTRFALGANTAAFYPPSGMVVKGDVGEVR